MTTTTTDDLPRIGELIAGRYRIEQIIGEGASSSVFACRHEILKKIVAVKVLTGNWRDEKVLARFLQEATIAAKLDHDRIVRVADVGNLPSGAPYIVMDRLEGEDLAAILQRRGAFPIHEAVDQVIEVLEAIGHAHIHKVVHRDVKPANVFISKDGTKLLDFGISKAMDGMSLTSTRAVLGSPHYMAPEVIRGARNASALSDIWSTGIVLFELLTTMPPFTARNAIALFELLALLKQPPSIRAVRPDIPPELDAVLQRFLAPDPKQRFQSAIEAGNALAPFASPRGHEALARLVRGPDSERAIALVKEEIASSPRMGAVTAAMGKNPGPTVLIGSRTLSDEGPRSWFYPVLIVLVLMGLGGSALLVLAARNRALAHAAAASASASHSAPRPQVSTPPAPAPAPAPTPVQSETVPAPSAVPSSSSRTHLPAPPTSAKKAPGKPYDPLSEDSQRQ